ncbi:MAG: DUF3127 domain-containing protein [Muribaculaceae bacterium]
MEVQGKIIKKLPLVTGTAKSTGNPWKKQDYVLETNEAHPKTIAFDFFGDRADQYNFEVGDEIVLSFDIESREYQGRYYTNIRGWKGEKVGAQQVAAANDAPNSYNAPAAPAAQEPFIASPTTDNDDLPF